MEDVREKLDAIFKAFKSYIDSQDYFDIVYSKKAGYLYIVVDTPDEAGSRQQYAEYKALRQDMIAYRTAKQNVDKIIGLVPEEQEQNREQKPER